MKRLRSLVIAAGATVLAAQAFGAHAAVLDYTFDAGSYFDFGYGNSYDATGGFDYNTVTNAVTNVTYSAIQTGTGPAGPFDFTAATATPTSITFTGDCCSDVDTYYFERSLALGGTDTIIGGAYSGTSISAGGSVSTPVPEPTTWTMMILGMGFLGLALRRRQAALAI